MALKHQLLFDSEVWPPGGSWHWNMSCYLTVKCDHLVAHGTETSAAICSLDKSKWSSCPVIYVVDTLYQNCIFGMLSIGIEPTGTLNHM